MEGIGLLLPLNAASTSFALAAWRRRRRGRRRRRVPRSGVATREGFKEDCPRAWGLRPRRHGRSGCGGDGRGDAQQRAA